MQNVKERKESKKRKPCTLPDLVFQLRTCPSHLDVMLFGFQCFYTLNHSIYKDPNFFRNFTGTTTVSSKLGWNYKLLTPVIQSKWQWSEQCSSRATLLNYEKPQITINQWGSKFLKMEKFSLHIAVSLPWQKACWLTQLTRCHSFSHLLCKTYSIF